MNSISYFVKADDSRHSVGTVREEFIKEYSTKGIAIRQIFDRFIRGIDADFEYRPMYDKYFSGGLYTYHTEYLPDGMVETAEFSLTQCIDDAIKGHFRQEDDKIVTIIRNGRELYFRVNVEWVGASFK